MSCHLHLKPFRMSSLPSAPRINNRPAFAWISLGHPFTAQTLQSANRQNGMFYAQSIHNSDILFSAVSKCVCVCVSFPPQRAVSRLRVFFSFFFCFVCVCARKYDDARPKPYSKTHARPEKVSIDIGDALFRSSRSCSRLLNLKAKADWG